MARNVMAAGASASVVFLSAACVAAHAMGPAAPFMAPNGGLPDTTMLDGGALNVQGLAGVRLGRQAGAVIDGQWVPRGESVRGAKLETITRTRVVLRHPDGHTESLDLFPPTSAGAAAASAPNQVPPK